MRRIASAVAAAVTLLAVACGGVTASIGGGCPDQPTTACGNACGDTWNPVCDDGKWVCPEVNTPSCVLDGGPVCSTNPPYCGDACGDRWLPDCEGGAWVCPPGPGCFNGGDAAADAACPATPIQCPEECGTTVDPECVNGAWLCPVFAGLCFADAAPPPPSLQCGKALCDGTTQYCDESGGGVALPDGGSNFSEVCDAIPAACAANPTCDCVKQTTANFCTCTQTSSGITIQCFAP